MTNDGKIVKLREDDGGSPAHLPAPLIRLRDLSANAMRQLLGEFFDSADDALFNMADKAGTNQEQTAYFEAMRELRLRRKHVTLALLQWLARAFNEVGRFSPRGNLAQKAVDRDSLTLVDNQDLEEQVALDNMVGKARSRYSETLKMFELRVMELIPNVQLAESQVPLSPEVLCFGLGEACSELSIDIRARLIVYKLFDKLMMGRLDQLYREVNEFLAREGVLPDMNRPPVSGVGAPSGFSQWPVRATSD